MPERAGDRSARRAAHPGRHRCRPDGQPPGRRARVATGEVAAVGSDLEAVPGRHRPRRPTGAWWPPGWSTCTPTCGSRAERSRRPSRPAPGPARSVGTPPWWPCPTPSRPSTRPRPSAACTTWPGRPPPRWRWPGPSPSGRAGERLAPMAELAVARACASSPMTATACSRPALMRRALEYATGLGVTLAQHCEDGHAGRRRGHARGRVVEQARDCPGTPALAEEVMVARDIALGPRRRRPHPLPPPVDRRRRVEHGAGRPEPTGLPVTAEVAPHHFTLTDECVAGYDPVFKVNPPLRPPLGRGRGQGGARSTGRSTPSPPTTPPTPPSSRTSPSTRPLRACSDWRPPSPWPWARPASPSTASSPCSAGSRPPSPGSTPPTGASRGARSCAGAVANICVIDPEATWTVDPARSASRSRNTPYAGRRMRGQVRHTVFRGEPVVIDGEAQR